MEAKQQVSIDPKIETDRLTLIRLTDTTPGSEHVQWFHEFWTDRGTTNWSPHGPTNTLDEFHEWMIEHLTKHDHWTYACFVKPREASKISDPDDDGRPGEHVGNVGLRSQPSGPTLEPRTVATLGIDTKPFDGEITPVNNKDVLVRAIGYGFFESGRGKGHATEANQGLLAASGRYVTSIRASTAADNFNGKRFYLEAHPDKSNTGSIHVLEKLGFDLMGWRDIEPIFLNGAWRDGAHPVYGLYV